MSKHGKRRAGARNAQAGAVHKGFTVLAYTAGMCILDAIQDLSNRIPYIAVPVWVALLAADVFGFAHETAIVAALGCVALVAAGRVLLRRLSSLRPESRQA